MKNLASFASQAATCQAVSGCNTCDLASPPPLSIIKQDIGGFFPGCIAEMTFWCNSEKSGGFYHVFHCVWLGPNITSILVDCPQLLPMYHTILIY
jgi:hypothetical protein